MVRAETNLVRIGIISTHPHPAVWPHFITRFGSLAWIDSSGPSLRAESIEKESMKLRLTADPVDIILVERGRISTLHPIWGSAEVKLIVSLDGWRGNFPSGDWSAVVKTISHEEVGGVTDGTFKVFVAARRGYDITEVFHHRASAAARLRHVLDPLEAGRKIPVPSKDEHPQGTCSRGLLRWSERFGKISSPTVYSKTNWVERPLSLKEWTSVLDLPPHLLKGNSEELEGIVRSSHAPGKVRVRILEDLSNLVVKTCKRTLPEMPSTMSTKKLKLAPSVIAARPRVDFNPPLEPEAQEGGLQRVETATVKATKADDAKVPVFLWDEQVRRVMTATDVTDSSLRKACDAMRTVWLLPRWKRNVRRDFRRWFRAQDEQKLFLDEADRDKSMRAGLKAIMYAELASWWNWDGGSFPFFWRWERPFQRDIRDGLSPRFMFDPPSCFDRQKASNDPEVKSKERAKIEKVIVRGYLYVVALTWLKSLMHYFSVPKGEDIRMVYDGSKSGLNSSLYCPWFAVPTCQSLERTVLPYTHQADNDFGDMFLNFQLHEELQKYTGVDVSDLFPELGSEGTTVVAWDRPAMGLKSSPYTAVQCSTRAKRMIMGDPKDPNNPFAWSHVVLNMPATEAYDPTLPWMFKMRIDGRIAGDAKAYIDDYRETGHDAVSAWRASSRVAGLEPSSTQEPMSAKWFLRKGGKRRRARLVGLLPT